MIDLQKIKEIDTNIDIVDFLNKTDFKNSKNNKVIGVSLSNEDNFMLKYYIEIKDIKKIEKLIVKETKLFKRLVKFADVSLHSSLAVGRKITSAGEIFDYFHIKFNRKLKLKSKNIFLKPLDFNKATFGFSLEYNNKLTIKKKYFYFKDNKSKEYLIKVFNLNIDCNSVSHFELYEANNNLKVNIIFDINKNKLVDNVLFKNTGFDHLSEQINLFNSYFNKTPLYFGFDKKRRATFYYNFNE